MKNVTPHPQPYRADPFISHTSPGSRCTITSLCLRLIGMQRRMQPWNKKEGSILGKQWLREMQKGKRPSCLKGRHSQAECPFPASVEEERRTHIKTSFRPGRMFYYWGREKDLGRWMWLVRVYVCVRQGWLLVIEAKAFSPSVCSNKQEKSLE